MTKDSRAGKFHLQIFINCPFDKKYQHLLHAIVFTVHLLGFRLRCSQEITQGDRLPRIIELMRGCKYGIHDISRIQRTGKLPRFNMPFELGLDIGIRAVRNGPLKSENLLILEAERDRAPKFLSDLKGWHISAHHNRVTEVITIVRNWLNDVKETGRPLPSGKIVFDEYRKFRRNLPQMMKLSELRGPVSEITYTDYSYLAAEFIRERHEQQLH